LIAACSAFVSSVAPSHTAPNSFTLRSLCCAPPVRRSATITPFELVNVSVPAYVGGISIATFVPAAVTVASSVVCALAAAGDSTPFTAGVVSGPVIFPPASGTAVAACVST